MTRRSPRLTGLRRSLALVLGFVAVLGPTVPVRAATPTFTLNLYTSSSFLYQDPYGTACTAAASMIMLNIVAYRHSGGNGFQWTPYRVKNNTANRNDRRDMTSILSFSRAHDTLSVRGSGSDAHGWRNALNYYGWGLDAMRDPDKNVYQDLEYTSFDAALHQAVKAIATYRMPVGVVMWAGRHAAVITGYIAYGEDPATSDNFVVNSIYLSDPLRADGYMNTRIAASWFRSGSPRVRFQRYRETDSPYDDPYVSGWMRSSVPASSGPSEWLSRYVIIVPVRAGLPDQPPNPDPTPSPTPPPDPTPTPPPDPTPTPSAAASSAP